MTKNQEICRRENKNKRIEGHRTIFFIFLIFSITLFSTSFVSAWVNSTGDDVGKTYLDDQLISYYNFDVDGNDSLSRMNCKGDAVQLDTNGIIGGYYNFSGAQKLNCSSNDLLKYHESHSVSFWTNITGGGSSGYFFSVAKQAGAGSNDFTTRMFKHVDDEEEVCILNDAGETCEVSTGSAIPVETWRHLVFVYYGGSNMSVYLDGSLLDSAAASDDFSDRWGSNPYLVLGDSVSFDNKFEGALDEFGIWNRSLNSTEIDDLYAGGLGISYGTSASSGNESSVSLISPTNATVISATSYDFTASYSVSNIYNITNATYWVWWRDNGTAFSNDQTNSTIDGTRNETTATISNFVVGNFLWNVKMCYDNATYSNCTWASSNYSVEAGASIDAQTYETTVYETNLSKFTTNISIIGGSNLYASRLVYNGTEYLAKQTNLGGGKYYIEREIDVPLLKGADQNISFFWQFEYLNDQITEQNSSIFNQTVKRLIFSKCNATLTDEFLNVTVYNETKRGLMPSQVDATFHYWMGTGAIYRNYSLNSTATSSEYRFCSNQNGTILTDSIMRAQKTDAANTTYSERTFYFNNQNYTNSSTKTKLFLINSTIDTNVIVQVRDSGLSPLEDYYIQIRRYYPEDNTYEVIERPKTDSYGQFVSKLVENDVKYKFSFYDSNNVLKKETKDMTIACRASICVLPFVIEDVASDIDRFGNLSDYDWGLSFDDTNNRFTFSWNDVSGKSATMRLLVTRYAWNGTTVVCNTTSTERAYALTCNVGDTSASYQAIAYRRLSGERERRIAQLDSMVGSGWRTFGNEGLIWSFLLLFTMIAIGYWYPPAGIALYLVGVITLMSTRIIYVSPAILFAQLAIGVAFIWAFHRKVGG